METNQYIKELKMQKPLLYFFLIALLTFGGINVSGIDQINAQSDFTGEGKNMGDLDWTLWGYRPNTWRMNFDFNRLTGSWAEYQDIPIEVPGSVHSFLTGTPSGPSIYSHPEQFGKGIHWDTHGPWKLPFSTSKRSMDEIREFWKQNDSFFFSEVGVSGAMSAQMIIFNKK